MANQSEGDSFSDTELVLKPSILGITGGTLIFGLSAGILGLFVTRSVSQPLLLLLLPFVIPILLAFVTVANRMTAVIRFNAQGITVNRWVGKTIRWAWNEVDEVYRPRISGRYWELVIKTKKGKWLAGSSRHGFKDAVAFLREKGAAQGFPVSV